MARPAHYRSANIRLSFHRALGSTLSFDSVGQDGAAVAIEAPISFDSPWDEEDGVRVPEGTPDRAFATLTWVDELAGRGGVSIVQIDAWTRIGAPTDAEADPYGIICDDLADEIEDLFAGRRADGTMKSWVPIYDYSSDPSDPALLGEGKCLLIGHGLGNAPGQPQSRRRWKAAGLHRIALVYTVQVITDAVRLHDYADS